MRGLLLHSAAATPAWRHAVPLCLAASNATASPDDYDEVDIFNIDRSSFINDNYQPPDLASLDPAFTEPGGEYELDLEEIDGLRSQFFDTKRRWAAGSGITTALNDPGSQLHAWWNDPIDGPEATSKRAVAMRAKKRQFARIVRPSLAAAALGLGVAAPARVAAVSLRFGVIVHLALPALRLAAAKVASLRRCGDSSSTPAIKTGPMQGQEMLPAQDLPIADPTHVFAAQHLFGALCAFPVATGLWISGSWFEALLVAAFSRLSLLPGSMRIAGSRKRTRPCAPRVRGRAVSPCP